MTNKAIKTYVRVDKNDFRLTYKAFLNKCISKANISANNIDMHEKLLDAIRLAAYTITDDKDTVLLRLSNILDNILHYDIYRVKIDNDYDNDVIEMILSEKRYVYILQDIHIPTYFRLKQKYKLTSEHTLKDILLLIADDSTTYRAEWYISIFFLLLDNTEITMDEISQYYLNKY